MNTYIPHICRFLQDFQLAFMNHDHHTSSDNSTSQLIVNQICAAPQCKLRRIPRAPWDMLSLAIALPSSVKQFQLLKVGAPKAQNANVTLG